MDPIIRITEEERTNKNLSIDDIIRADEEKRKKKLNNMKYLVLYYGTDENGNDMQSFEVLEGRVATYEYIKGMIEYIDIYESKVIAETASYKDALSVYEYMKHVSQFFEEDSFDIDDYK